MAATKIYCFVDTITRCLSRRASSDALTLNCRAPFLLNSVDLNQRPTYQNTAWGRFFLLKLILVRSLASTSILLTNFAVLAEKFPIEISVVFTAAATTFVTAAKSAWTDRSSTSSILFRNLVCFRRKIHENCKMRHRNLQIIRKNQFLTADGKDIHGYFRENFELWKIFALDLINVLLFRPGRANAAFFHEI